jgi:4-hydroxy-tetrahydrodipicolinate synthase
MARHPNFEPKGVIPACILPFHEDLKIDERAYRQHLRHTADVHGVSAITVNAHATEVASCSFEEQRRVLDVTMDEIGDRTPVVSGVYADRSAEAARITRMADAGGASALLVYTPYAADPLARLSCCLTKRAYGLQSLD